MRCPYVDPLTDEPAFTVDINLKKKVSNGVDQGIKITAVEVAGRSSVPYLEKLVNVGHSAGGQLEILHQDPQVVALLVLTFFLRGEKGEWVSFKKKKIIYERIEGDSGHLQMLPDVTDWNDARPVLVQLVESPDVLFDVSLPQGYLSLRAGLLPLRNRGQVSNCFEFRALNRFSFSGPVHVLAHLHLQEGDSVLQLLPALPA